jgi:putative phosphoesterase
MLRIGVISDTHNFLDPKVPELFAGVDHILHAGDIGQTRLILQLEAIAPVSAVLGNTDDAGLHFRQTEIVELGGHKFLIHHIVNPHALDEALEQRLERERPAVVVFGHTHKQFSERIRSTLFFNPGYAGKSRFGMPRSIAVLDCSEKDIRPEFIPLA